MVIMNCIKRIFSKSSIPPLGVRIRITWLPYNNSYPDKNVYIGSEGVVKEYYPGGRFGLWLGGALLLLDKPYRWIKI